MPNKNKLSSIHNLLTLIRRWGRWEPTSYCRRMRIFFLSSSTFAKLTWIRRWQLTNKFTAEHPAEITLGAKRFFNRETDIRKENHYSIWKKKMVRKFECWNNQTTGYFRKKKHQNDEDTICIEFPRGVLKPLVCFIFKIQNIGNSLNLKAHVPIA